MKLNGKLKKTLKITGAAFCVCIFLFVCADLGIRFFTSREFVKNYALKKISAALGRDVRLARLYASFFGIRVHGLEVSEAGGFDKGIFVSARKCGVRVAPFH